MFTGIVEEIGTIRSIRKGINSCVLIISAKAVLEGTRIGDSIAVSGACLTVTGLGKDQFSADVMPETMERTAFQKLTPGSFVNLERAMAADGRFGGHIVSGHIDGIGRIQALKRDDNAVWVTVAAPKEILRYIVEKGSIAMDGVSLTVAKVGTSDFAVSLIPHTASKTTLLKKKVGDPVNLECDIVGKYVEKLLHSDQPSGLTRQMLAENGFV